VGPSKTFHLNLGHFSQKMQWTLSPTAFRPFFMAGINYQFQNTAPWVICDGEGSSTMLDIQN
jgi:hypothetical protein